jgi:hypothetical protein
MARKRGKTISEQRYGMPPDADDLVKLWNNDLKHKLLSHVWQAYDQLYAHMLCRLAWTEEYDDLERSITHHLELSIRDTLDKYLPYTVQHGVPEHESRQPPPARPPEYDIAFIWRANPRIMWPLEAKVIRTDDDTNENLGDYIQTIEERYLTCRYAPFSNGGAMICYFRSGNPGLLLQHLERRLACSFADYPPFADRSHKISEHMRSVPHGKPYPIHFRCHHMVLPLART